MQNGASPPPSFHVQEPQLVDTRASLMIAVADTHARRSKLLAFHALLGDVKLGAFIEESHKTPITFNEASGRRCRSMPSPREPYHEIQRFGSGDPCADLFL